MKNKGIHKGLEQDAREVKERIPVEMTHKKAHQVAALLKQFMTEHEYTQARVAKMLGYSTSAVSQFLDCKYKGNIAELVNRAVNLMNSVARREKRVRNKPFIETTVAKAIGMLITETEAFTDDEGKIGLLIGDGGHGKSHCMRYYAKANKNTVYVELDAAMTPTMIFAEIAKELGIDSSGSLALVTRRLIDNLQNRHIIVMLDEASSLKVKQLNQLRQIVVVKSRCPLILAGNRDLLKTVMQDNTRRGFESLDQFTSRLMCILDLDRRASNKDGGLYTAKDIRELYEYGGIRLTGDAVSTLGKIAKTPKSGRLRTCSHIIAACHISEPALMGNLESINTEFIIAAIRELDLPVRTRLPVRAEREPAEEQEEQLAVAKAS